MTNENDKKPKTEQTVEQTTEKVEKVENTEQSEAHSDHHQQQAQANTGNVYEGEAEVVDSEEISSEDKNWSMFGHLSAFVALLPIVPIIGMILGPLVIWLLKRNDSTIAAENAKEALNFNITMFIAYCVAIFFCITIIGLIVGIPMLLALPIVHFILIVVAAIKSNEGQVYKYPFALRLVN